MSKKRDWVVLTTERTPEEVVRAIKDNLKSTVLTEETLKGSVEENRFRLRTSYHWYQKLMPTIMEGAIIRENGMTRIDIFLKNYIPLVFCFYMILFAIVLELFQSKTAVHFGVAFIVLGLINAYLYKFSGYRSLAVLVRLTDSQIVS